MIIIKTHFGRHQWRVNWINVFYSLQWELRNMSSARVGKTHSILSHIWGQLVSALFSNMTSPMSLLAGWWMEMRINRISLGAADADNCSFSALSSLCLFIYVYDSLPRKISLKFVHTSALHNDIHSAHYSALLDRKIRLKSTRITVFLQSSPYRLYGIWGRANKK